MICFAWTGFPQYAARCVGAYVKSTDEEVRVIATRPGVPIEGMEKACGCPVVWTDGKTPLLDHAKDIRILFVSGWCEPMFNALAEAVCAKGGKVVALVDNNFVLSAREILKALRFRLCLRGRYDGYFVPGASGRRLLRFYGVPEGKIVEGMYSADEKLFYSDLKLSQRPKNVIYVGQFIPRKNVLRMCEAFVAAVERTKAQGWTFTLYGSGELEPALREMAAKVNGELVSLGSKITVNRFMQPEDLAARYRESRIFVLPSLEEHWGVVVHEAALSGCVMLLSKGIGAVADFVGKGNGFVFKAEDVDGMTRSFIRALTLPDAACDAAQQESLALAGKVGLGSFVAGMNKFLLL